MDNSDSHCPWCGTPNPSPQHAGGSDTATQSINCCLALQHLSHYAHAILMLDNQVLLDQLDASNRQTSSSSSSNRKVARGSITAVSGRACLQGVNELAAQALAGLLWPVGDADQLACNTNIRQLVSALDTWAGGEVGQMGTARSYLRRYANASLRMAKQ